MLSSMKTLGSTVVATCAITTLGYAENAQFQAFSWSRNHPAATSNVLPLNELSPWTDIPKLAEKLNALPVGRRWIILYCLTDWMADNPADRCLSRTTTLVTRYVTVAPQPVATPVSKTVLKGKAKRNAKLARTVALAKPAAPTIVPVTTAVNVDTPTVFRGPWMDAGVDVTKSSVTRLLTALRATGVELDGIVVDNETDLGAAFIVGAPGSAAAIQADPRWPALARATGLPLTLTGMNWGTDLYFNWTDKMTGRFDAALNQAVFEPAKAIFPKASVSNYNSGAISRTNAWPDINGHIDRKTTPGFGTHDTHEFYGWLAPGRVAKVKGTQSVSDAWVAFRLEIFKARGMIASSNRPKQAWIASKSWAGETWGKVAFAGNPLWDELILQLGMHGFNTFLEFSPSDSSKTVEQNTANTAIDRAALDSALGELNVVAGNVGGAPILASQPKWDDRVVATGRRLNEGQASSTTTSPTLWRFSFGEDVDNISLHFTDGTTAKLVPESGRRGCWYVQPADKMFALDATGRLPEMVIEAINPVGSTLAVSR